MGGEGGGFLNTALGNIFNPGVSGGKKVALTLFDPGGVMGTIGSQFAPDKAYQEMGVGEDPNGPILEPEPTPIDPQIALDEATEAARQEEMRKRRIRTKTLLSDQQDQGTATVGTKVLLGS